MPLLMPTGGFKSLQANRQPSFFISCQPGMEQDVLDEIKEVWSFLIERDGSSNSLVLPEFKLIEGGLEAEFDLMMACQLNFFLKSASRILMRIMEFRCRDLPKLFQKVNQFNWSGLLLNGCAYSLQVAASGSRLNNEKRIEKTIREAVEKAIAKSNNNANLNKTLGAIDIYVRVVEDQFTLSVDLSGEHLHKRNWAVKKGSAPLRETIAASMLRLLISDCSLQELRQVNLVDPMCGSGTLLTEAATLHWPNWWREYSFKYLKDCPRLLLQEKLIGNYRGLQFKPIFNKFYGYDRDSKMVDLIHANLTEIKDKSGIDLTPDFETLKRDLFEDRFVSGQEERSGQDLNQDSRIKGCDLGGSFGESKSKMLWIVCNPPYGERLQQSLNIEKTETNSENDHDLGGSSGSKGQVDYLKKWLSTVNQTYRPERIVFIYPIINEESAQKCFEGFRILRTKNIRHGGIRVRIWVLTPKRG